MTLHHERTTSTVDPDSNNNPVRLKRPANVDNDDPSLVWKLRLETQIKNPENSYLSLTRLNIFDNAGLTKVKRLFPLRLKRITLNPYDSRSILPIKEIPTWERFSVHSF